MSGVAEVIIGLDVGTTAVKVAAFAVDADAIGAARAPLPSSSREYPLEQPSPGWQVQDPPTVLAAVDGAITGCVAQLDGARVVGLALSTAMHGLIGLDSQRRPLTPLVTWADSRGTPEARRLKDMGLARVLLQRTGTPVHPMSPLVKLVWFARQEPDLARRVRWWVGLKDYLLHHLTGQLVTELSSASATGLLDLQTRDWDGYSLGVAEIRHDQLPPVLSTTTVLTLTSDVATAVGLPTGTPVAVGAADGPLGNLGTGAIEPGIAGLSLGTSGAVRMAVPKPSFDPAGRLFCYALTDDLWVVGGAISNGGITLRWAGETFAPDVVADGHADKEVLALAASVPAGSDGLVMLPYVLSERAPLWDAEIAGAFLGVRHHHTRTHFIRAAVEGVCLQMSTLVDALDAVAPVQSIRATGGPFRSTLWRQVMAATLARPLTVQADAGGTALGAAALGWYALGGAPTLADALVAVGGPRADLVAVPVPVSATDVATYARLRASVPALIAAYEQVGAIFAAAPTRSGSSAATD
ncbi:MAG: Gluconokinase [uncultured Propionibacteriaceae bacterium]|uniref:Gluconokinase n=1 Tax=uncultured Propionibacteriaceae bacterium TaxID=257457 RepID=A0A6J4N9E7_9ACTN|nr:MAG: Gluconokinase [uncultured Propionibacteriaceae bacterium]